MATSLSTDLKEAYCQALQELPAEALALVARAGAARGRSPAERDQALAAVVLSYRQGPRRLWAPVLLGLLGSALLECLQRLREERPVLEEEDLRQQLVVELLHLADSLPLRDGRYLRRRLLRRTNQAVRRWLLSERLRRSSQVSFDELEELRR
jgi:hypothetical protein